MVLVFGLFLLFKTNITGEAGLRLQMKKIDITKIPTASEERTLIPKVEPEIVAVKQRKSYKSDCPNNGCSWRA